MTGRPDDWKGSDGRARSEVVTYLSLRGGEVFNSEGLAVVDMQQHLGRSRSLSNLLRTMEHDGMITREVRGRRTYRIKLVDDWGLNDPAMLDGSVRHLHPVSIEDARRDGQGDVDYGLLAESLLAIVMRKVSEPAPARPDKLTVERLRKAETTIGRLEAQLTELDDDRKTLRARVAELEEQTRIYEHNVGVLRAELDKPKSRRGGGTPLEERLSKEERGMLAELMRTLPETPQSNPRRTR